MKRYYLMIEASRLFDEDSQLYKFRVGSSVREQAALNVVKKYAVQHGFYISEWTVDTRDFVFKLAESIGRTYLQLNWNYMECAMMARYIRNCSALPRKTFLSPHEAAVRRMLGEVYHE